VSHEEVLAGDPARLDPHDLVLHDRRDVQHAAMESGPFWQPAEAGDDRRLGAAVGGLRDVGGGQRMRRRPGGVSHARNVSRGSGDAEAGALAATGVSTA
jgi:hypothetical protein